MAEFDRVGDQFLDYYSEVRGYVREHLIRQQLMENLPAQPAGIIDIGGGDGRDSAWLAEQGYNVTLVDPSVEMIARAHQRFRTNNLEIETYQIDPSIVSSELKGHKFDVVLSHGVLMYCLEDPAVHIATLAGLINSGGIVSLATKGFAGAIYRAMYRQDTKTARSIIETEQDINNLGLKVWAYSPERVEEMLGMYALKVLDWRGIRIVSEHDRRSIKNISKTELSQIIKIETKLGKDFSSRGMGQMLHFIAQKV